MDKNMINIDDLVRLRLAGGEEKERPGAWLQMKDLLDKEMPVKVAVGYNWRRAFTAAALLLLIGSATIGSYKLYTNKMAEGGEGARPVTTSTVTEGGGTSGNVSVATESNSSKSNENAKGPEGMSGNDGKQNNPVVVATTTNTKTEKANDQKTSNNKTDNHLVTSHTATAKPSKTTSAHAAVNDANEAAKNEVAVDNSLKSNKKNHSNNTYASGGKLPKHALTTPATGTGNVAGNDSKLAKGKKGSHKASAPTNAVPSNPAPPVYNSGATTPAPAVTASTAAPQRQPVDFRKSNPRYVDSANYTYVSEKLIKGTYRVDTIDKGIMAMNREGFASGTEVNANPESASANSNVNPNAEPPASDEKLSRKERRAERKRYVQSSLWEKMVANAKPNFNDVSLHPGLMVGLSSTSGQYHMMGIQAGFAAKLNLSERWGILSELKLLYRFGNGKSFDNNYNSWDGEPRLVGGNNYSFRVDSQEHSFNITSTSLLELPIAIRYSVNKLNFFAGANFAYNFPVNVEERFGKVYTREVIGGAGTGEQLREDWKNNNDPKLSPAEFGARFSMGYLLGVGYQVTPKVGLDLRASQVFWDNGKVHSTGAFLVSKEMYRAPCFQLNFTYRLQGSSNRPMKAR